MGKKVYLAEASRTSGLSIYTLRQLCKQKKICYFRAGEGLNGKLVFDLDLLDKDITRIMTSNLQEEPTSGKIRRVV